MTIYLITNENCYFLMHIAINPSKTLVLPLSNAQAKDLFEFNPEIFSESSKEYMQVLIEFGEI